MDDSTNISHTISTKTKSKIKTRDATMMTKVSKSHESGVCYPVDFYPRNGKNYGENVDGHKSYVLVQDKRKVNILIYNWNEVFGELKDQLCTDITIIVFSFMISFTSIYGHLFLLV